MNPAVFARNHRKYLEEASKLSPIKPVTFRSATTWIKAAKVLENNSTIPIYFAVIGEGSNIAFKADLIAIQLNPGQTDPETKKFLGFSLHATAKEGLWEKDEKPVSTLYIVKRCRRLRPSFPFSDLVKISNHEPIAPNYRYSYSVVFQRGSEPDVINLLPGELENPEQHWEGATRQVSITTYERSSAARQACLQYHGYDCSICGFNFGSTYGKPGEGFIHVHHLVPLSEINETYKVDPINDLIPLCPNCHAMIHSVKPPLDVEAVKDMLRSNLD